MKKRTKKNWSAYLYVLPLLLLSFAFIYYCIGRTVFVSFTDWNGMSDSMNMVGVKNYAKLFNDKTFYIAIRNNVLFFAGTVFIQAGVGFFLAVLLKYKFRGSNLFKTIYFMPIAMATSIITAVFRIILNPTNGDLNTFFRAIGLDGLAVNWLGDKQWALVAIIIVNIFQWMGFSMINYYAAVMTIPDDVYESAMLDGAGFWRTTFRITFPMVKGTTNLLLILGIVGSLKTFDIVKLLTGGGPGRATTVLNTYLYEKAFDNYAAGESAAIGVCILLLALIMSYMQIRLSREKD